jgi:hypothetical protein
MKRIAAMMVCGFVVLAAGCASSNNGASAGMVADKKCCSEKMTCNDGKGCADKAAPGMVGTEKKECGSTCTEKKECTDKPAAGMVADKKDCATACSGAAKSCSGTKN